MASQLGNGFRPWLWVWAIALVAALGMTQRASAQTLTNTDIVKMVQAKLGDDVIISEIKHSICNFDTSPSALIKLKEAGVSDRVLEAMTEAVRSGNGERPASSSPTSNGPLPVPENYGVYAVSEGHLVQLDAQQVHAYKTVAVRLGQRNGVGNILQGQPVATSTVANLPEFGADFKVIVFSQSSGLTSPLMIAESLSLKPLVFVRYVTIDTGFPNYVRRGGVENGWDSGQAPEFESLGIGTGGQPKPLALLFRPMPGHSDMVIATPSQPLKPGVYRIGPGEGSPLSGAAVLFAVPPIRDAEAAECADATVTYGAIMSENARYRRCSGPPAPSQSAAGPPNGSTSAGGSRALLPCSDYKSCLKAGFSAETVSDWQASIDDFRAAAAKSPTSPLPWVLLGEPYLQAGQIGNFSQSWDKALKMGGSVGFDAWHQVAFGVERGAFQLSASLVSFRDQKGKTVFAAPPAEVKVVGAYTIQNQAYLRLRVAGRNYNLLPIPFRVSCQVQLTVECPPQGVTEQQLLTRYVAQAVPKLASGALAQPNPSQTSASCTGATDLGYSIEIGQQAYKVEAFGPAGPNRVHVFFDQAGGVVRDRGLLQRLALGAWTKEMIEDRYSPGSGSGEVKAFLATSTSLQGWEATTDALARATVESIKAVVTGGASLNTAAENLTLGVAKNQLLNPKVALAHWAHAGLEHSLADYTQMEGLLPPAGTREFKLPDLESVESLYTQANTLRSVNEALAAALAPTTWQDEFANYLSSAVSEIWPSLPSSDTLLTLNDVLKLEQYVAATGQSFGAYKQSLGLALQVAASTEAKISSWANEAATACSSRTARSAVPPSMGAEATF